MVGPSQRFSPKSYWESIDVRRYVFFDELFHEHDGEWSMVNPVCPIGQPVLGTGGKMVKLLPTHHRLQKSKNQEAVNAISQHP